MTSLNPLSARAARAAALALVLVFPACGGDSDDNGTTTPSGPSQASITVTCQGLQSAADLVGPSPRLGFTFRFTVPCTITESAGLGASINFVRMRLQVGGADVEVQEISGNDIVASTGSNRINASQSRTSSFIFDFNRGDAQGGVLLFNFTDDRGNVLTATLNFTA